MYAYFAKGMTVGHVLTRVVLREITSIPGIMLDLMFAIFWVPDYSSYWAEDTAYIEYVDGTRHHGVMRGLFGWIGEIAGFVIGGTVGAIIGTALFFPDLLLRGMIFLKEKLYRSIDNFAIFIGETRAFDGLAYAQPTNYAEKAWNIGSATLGMVITAIPYTAAKILEFFLPFLYLSHPIFDLSAVLGGALGCTIIYPPIFLLGKVVDLVNACRNFVLNAVALTYAKSGEIPIGPNNRQDECCVPYQAVHTAEFRDNVAYYGRTSWAQLIFGPLKQQDPAATSAQRHEDHLSPSTLSPTAQRHRAHASSNLPEDPITQDPLGVNGVRTVIDRQGHTFNDDRGTGTHGIRFWLRDHHTCPVGREELHEDQLIPNRAFDDLLNQRRQATSSL